MVPLVASGFHFGKEIEIPPPVGISCASVIEKVTVVISPTTSDSELIEAAVRVPTVAVSVIPVVLLSKAAPVESCVSTVKDEVLVVVAGFVNP